VKKINQKGFGAIGVVVLVLVLAAAGGVGYYVFNKNKTKTPANSTSTDSSNTTASKSITVPNRGTYYLQEPSETTTVYAQTYNKTTAKYDENKSAYVTVMHPEDWAVYKRDADQEEDDPFVGYIIKSPNEHFLHIFNQGGSGGDCQSNTKSYTLTKKLPTQTADLSFTAYDNGNLSLEGFGTQRLGYKSTTLAKHEALKEGESNTDTCNLSFYSVVLNYMSISASSSTKSELASNLKWDDIKEDTDFVAMLQSLKVTGTSQ